MSITPFMNWLVKYLGLILVISGVVIMSHIAAISLSSASANSHKIEENGISFETLVVNPIWLIPENGLDTETSVKVGIRITNNTHSPIRFSRFDTLYPNLVKQDGQVLQREGGRDGTLPLEESDFPLVIQGKSVTFFLVGILHWQNNNLLLEFSDGFGGLWYFDNLIAGAYKFGFLYYSYESAIQIDKPQRRKLEGIWVGQISTPLTDIQLLQQ